LGEIPAHWQAKRLKYVAPIIDERSSAATSDLPYVGLENIESGAGRLTSTVDSLSPIDDATESAATLFQAGDVLFGKLRPYLAKVLRPQFAGRCSTELLVLRSTGEIATPMLAYQLLSRDFIAWVDAMTYGTKMPRASPDQVMNVLITLPPMQEQAIIASFLDRETAKIDALVAKKERLIELLQERRSALITRAVTKGLDPTIRMKDSGIEWLGEIPTHWDVNRTKFAAKLRTGHTPSRQHPEYWENCTIPWFGLADVWQIRDGRREYVTDTAEKISELGLANSAAELLPKGTVILSRTASVGFSAIMGADMATTQDFVNWVCGPTLRPEYLLYVFRAMYDEFQRLTMGSTHQTIYMPDVGQFSTPIPPLSDQDDIVDFIRRNCGKIDELVDNVREAINHLKELRVALISAAVTGKIDVREEAA
jgi:type I restriction enzyme S subunit